MTDLSKSASPSEPPKIIICDGCHFSYDYAETNSLYCLRCLRMKAHLEAAEPRRDEREAAWQKFLAEEVTDCIGYPDCDGDLEAIQHSERCPEFSGEKHPSAKQIFETGWVARASAAPLKQTAEIRNQVLEEAALETLSFLKEVSAEKWPPFGLCPERNRAGDSAETARNIAGAIRKLKSAASLPQPSAGHADVEVFADHAEECMQPIGLTTCGYPRAHIIHNNKASMSYHNFMPPSAGQTEGK